MERMLAIQSTNPANVETTILQLTGVNIYGLWLSGTVDVYNLTIKGGASSSLPLIYSELSICRFVNCIFIGSELPEVPSSTAILTSNGLLFAINCAFRGFKYVFNIQGSFVSINGLRNDLTKNNTTFFRIYRGTAVFDNFPTNATAFTNFKEVYSGGSALVGNDPVNTIRVKLDTTTAGTDEIFLLGELPELSSDDPHFTNITEGKIVFLRTAGPGSVPAMKSASFAVNAGYREGTLSFFTVEITYGNTFALGSFHYNGVLYVGIRQKHAYLNFNYNYIKGDFNGSMPMSMIGKRISFNDVTDWTTLGGTGVV
jgi:hypothetical protein